MLLSLLLGRGVDAVKPKQDPSRRPNNYFHQHIAEAHKNSRYWEMQKSKVALDDIPVA